VPEALGRCPGQSLSEQASGPCPFPLHLQDEGEGKGEGESNDDGDGSKLRFRRSLAANPTRLLPVLI
jgi:hypothetical protein